MNEKQALADHGALITGASRGIGRELALALGRAGAAVAVSGRAQVDLEQVVRRITDAGGRAVALPADLDDDEQLVSLPARAAQALGRLTILINNAGLGLFGRVEACPLADWDAVMRVNARAPFVLCREAIPLLRAAGGGTIINISSVVGVKGYVNQGAYAASKHALMGFSKVLAQEVQADNIRVHTLCPGAVDTEMVAQARPDLDRTKLIRAGELAEIVLFLLTHRNNAVIDDIHVRRASGEPWF